VKLRYFSVCSGIEAATVAWSPLGFPAAAFSEVEPFPCAVLAHHYPEVPNLGDMTRINGATYRGLVDILVGGTPCQAFSVAGLRQGLEDARGNLTLTFLELANAIDPAFVVWENVPGVLSDKTNAFGCLLGGLVGADNALENVGRWPNCGVVRGPRRTAAWRVLDAQYFGLAQRRQRVFLVACPRNGADPAEVLFERQGMQRHTAPSREAGQGSTHDVAPCIGASGRGFERGGDTRGQDPVVAVPDVSPPLMCGGGNPASHSARSGRSKDAVLCVTGQITHALKAEGADASEDGTGRGNPIVCFGGNNTSGPIDVATARNASGTASGRLDFESETFAVVLRAAHGLRLQRRPE
jgi:DNA (cytosine-5)-methyltransferase 1